MGQLPAASAFLSFFSWVSFLACFRASSPPFSSQTLYSLSNFFLASSCFFSYFFLALQSFLASVFQPNLVFLIEFLLGLLLFLLVFLLSAFAKSAPLLPTLLGHLGESCAR